MRALATLFLPAVLACTSLCRAQNDSNWSSSSERRDPSGNTSPVRTRETHTESGGRSVDRRILERLGPDGQYVPYLETETESVRVDASTVRTTERTFGTSPDGGRALVQQTQSEARTLAGGETNTVRTTSNPDANGALQIVQREVQRTRQISPDVQETRTTVLTPSVNGGLAPALQVDEREQKNADGTIGFRKSTSLPDGAGNWQVGEVREGTRLPEGGGNAQAGGRAEERVLRPDANGTLSVVERTVTRQSDNAPGDRRQTRETYSSYVPGVAGNDAPQLVERATTIQRSTAAGERTTTREVEQPTPGSPGDGLRRTERTIDVVQPGAGGVASQQRTVVRFDDAGSPNAVWVNVGQTSNPAVVQLDTKPAPAAAPGAAAPAKAPAASATPAAAPGAKTSSTPKK